MCVLSILKYGKGFYIIQFNTNKGQEYKKYFKKWKPPRNNSLLYLDTTKKKWISKKPKNNKRKTLKYRKL